MIRLKNKMVLAVTVLLSGCTFGPSISGLSSLSRGEGIQVEIARKSRPTMHVFELLSAENDGLYLHLRNAEVSDALYWIAYEDVAAARFSGMSRLDFNGADGSPPSRLHEMRLVSRYPQGIDDRLLDILLKTYDQDEIATLQ